jgi:hypothetical protein
LTISEQEANRAAIDVVFELLGIDDPINLVKANIISANQLNELKALQQMIFDSDSEGRFIRDGITFKANGLVLEPDEPLLGCFVPDESDGLSVKSCKLTVISKKFLQGDHQDASSIGEEGNGFSSPNSSNPTDFDKPMHDYALIMLMHQISIGAQIDVTKENPEIASELSECEKNLWLEIDVKTASYKLTQAGYSQLKRHLDEAQDLIKRYDIFCDVDLDSQGCARFDTGLGKDLRVAVWESEQVDPFRARFILGLNDGEWNNLSNWMEVVHDKSWYDSIFRPIEAAASVSQIGAERLQKIIEQGKEALRKGDC